MNQQFPELGCYGLAGHSASPLAHLLGTDYPRAFEAARSERGDAMFAAMVERSCAAMRDHGTLELVR